MGHLSRGERRKGGNTESWERLEPWRAWSGEAAARWGPRGSGARGSGRCADGDTWWGEVGRLGLATIDGLFFLGP
ncbi:hypothetical protein TIFTF001_029106 [Ficus carica]|uniref:Uncharacterized protein n=1 Tax=Ficus carica TaxID=3494 RepID=A0AA88DV66_FICCA|nr:hypothetical protein TIFTF001_029106 [Ficus carica]